jgi:FdhE protein
MGMEADKINKAVDANKKEYPGYEGILDLFGRIMIKQSEFSSKTKIEALAIAEEEAHAKLKKGIPVLSKGDFQVDVCGAYELFQQLCSILKSQNKDLSDKVARIEASLKERKIMLKEIFEDILTDGHGMPKLPAELSLDKDAMFILATASLKPSLEANASYVSSMLGSLSWSGHCCPVCGSSQAISELRKSRRSDTKDVVDEGAERILHCSFCGTEWRTARIGCTFCGNVDSESLIYLYIEGDNGHRIDVCEKCKNYIKTVDSNVITHEVVPAVEDIATLHLDIIAEEEGYKRKEWFMPYRVI